MLQSVGLQSRTRLSDWTATTRDISRRGKSTETGGRLVVSRTGRKEAAGERSDSSVGTELLFVGMKSTKLDSDSSRTVNVLRATELYKFEWLIKNKTITHLPYLQEFTIFDGSV